MQVALHSIKNVITATIKAISLPYAGDPKQIGDQITLINLVPEAGQEDYLPE